MDKKEYVIQNKSQETKKKKKWRLQNSMDYLNLFNQNSTVFSRAFA